MSLKEKAEEILEVLSHVDTSSSSPETMRRLGRAEDALEEELQKPQVLMILLDRAWVFIVGVVIGVAVAHVMFLWG